MIESLYIAESGMVSQQKLIDVISNNIANISTPGFKKSSVNFSDIVSNSELSQDSGNEVSRGQGVMIQHLMMDFQMGDLKQTGNVLDIAVNGAGFIPVTLEDGTQAYTRGGRLQVNEQGFLTTLSGNTLTAGVVLPPDVTDLTFTASGTVLGRVQGGNELIELGQIDLVRFTNQEAMQQIGNNLYRSGDSAGEISVGKPSELGMGQLIQGFTEMANVSMNEEMVSLMLAQRGYQLNARLVQVADQILETINNIRR